MPPVSIRILCTTLRSWPDFLRRSIPEQRALLEKSSSRKILNRVEKDSASLIAHRDTASLVSRCTDNLSKLSLVFGFDGELFLTKVYDRAHRASVKATLRRQQYDTTSVKNRISYKKNEEIEKTIRADRKTQGREVKILLLGTSRAVQRGRQANKTV